MFFSKQKDVLAEPFVIDILDSQDHDIVVADRECRILLMNAAAKARLPEGASQRRCKSGYSRLFPDLCEFCPNTAGGELEGPADHDIRDEARKYYAARFSTVRWVDGKKATAIFLRDVDSERQASEKLYNLAYIDQLTGVANRTRLREDFEAAAKKIEHREAMGILAIFDLDNFKAINDTYGHATGDIILRRLTGYLEGDEAFRGHLYRLGGDEFVLFYCEPADRFTSQEQCRAFYGDLLRGALRAYTIPNIEASCTISVGVAFYPWHGETYSELLRRADIALYKAKESGRNRICTFEEHYDTAKKFKDLYINIQPMLNAEGRTYAYELVDQGNETNEDEDAINLNEFNRTMEALGLDDLESDTLYFISYSNQLLNRTVMEHFPKNKFIIQIRLGEAPTDKELKRYAELRASGYSLAMAGVSSANALPELISLAYYCKFDPRETDEDFRRSLISQNPSRKFIATGVDDRTAFDAAREQGYALFQGYYFNQPGVTKKTKDIDPLRVNYLRLLKLTSTNDYVNFQEISSIIAADVALSYRLLRLLNSAAVGLRNPISSISMAVAYLGEVSLKKWIAMLALRGVATDKPMEIIRLSLIRAQFGEMLTDIMKPRRDAKHVFLVGLLSLLDVALDKSKEEVFEEIPVAEEIRDSILGGGPHADLLKFFTDYEYANWEEVALFAARNQLRDSQINTAYLASVKWYNDLLNIEHEPLQTAER